MSDAVELLNSLDEGISTEEGHIVIDSDRFITVPEKLKRLGVQYDHDIETVTFDCPRYWDEHDLSTLKIYINYLRSDNVPGVYEVTNISVDESNENIIHFDWIISKNVTLTLGKIAFLVCAKSVDEDGYEERHWNSELCKDCYISEGLELTSGTAEEIRPDIIEQWYKAVIEVIAEAESVTNSIIEMRDNGEFDGTDGVGITSIEQTTTSVESGGENVVTISLSDGQTSDIRLRNGFNGVDEIPIASADNAVDDVFMAYGDDLPIVETREGNGQAWVNKGKQIVFINRAGGSNSTINPKLSLNDGEAIPIRLRLADPRYGYSDFQPGGASDYIPIGSLMNGVPYTMTFCGKYWLIDSHIHHHIFTANENVCVGIDAGSTIIDSLAINGDISGNVAIGSQAAPAFSYGNGNVVIGAHTADGLEEGNYNIIIGGGCDIPAYIGYSHVLNIGGLITGLMDNPNQYMIVNGGLSLPEIPTQDPHISGRVWNDNGTLKISAG